MKKVLVFIICFLLTTSLAWAETPESISKSYFEFVKHQQWDEISGLYDPVALRDFREMMSFLIEVPDEKSSVVLARFFGPGTTKASLKAMSDASFFSSFLKSTMSMAVQLGQLDFKKIDVLGSVPEGTNLRHVVARTFTGMGEMSMEQMNVISFKKTNEGWKMLMQAKMKGMAQQLKRTISLFGTKTALSESPVQDGGSYFKRGNSYFNEGQYDKAISEYNKAIEINPKYNKAYTSRGAAYDRRGQFDQAISDFNKAIEINPTNTSAYYNIGCIYSLQNNLSKALKYLELALENGHNNFDWISKDPDWDNIRSSNEFKMLIEKYKK